MDSASISVGVGSKYRSSITVCVKPMLQVQLLKFKKLPCLTISISINESCRVQAGKFVLNGIYSRVVVLTDV